MDVGGSVGTVDETGDFGDIVSGSSAPGDTGEIASGDFKGNLNFLQDHISRRPEIEIYTSTYRSSLPSASGFGLLGLTDSTLCDRLGVRFGFGFGAGEIFPP